ncbi:alpha/beta hydrolase [Streptomyces sp. SAI-170]|uniref:alpha/beta hydrolase n=1 Tax=Streptomyces sp. SAI-170 TaxID=3377729 RepID=UPI003C7B11DD
MKKSTRHSRAGRATLLGLAGATAAAGLGLGLTAPATASPSMTTASPSTLRWGACEGGGPGLDPRQQCATLSVPMDYAKPDGKQIRIAVSRLPSEDPSARRGALLLIPGGPGGTSIGQPSEKAKVLPQEVRDAYDLIGFAPRGMAPSTAVTCDLDTSDLAATKLRPWPAPDGSVEGNMANARRMSEACARNGGELIRHISTANEARDLDRIRAALGERRISAWGVSYGTYVGAVYGELFPHRTDRFVLDSNDNPDPDRVGRAWLAGFEQGVEDTFPEFARYASTPGTPDRVAATSAEVRRVFLELAARLDRAPLPRPGANPPVLDGNELRQAMLTSLYDPDGYPALAQLINAARKGQVPPAPPAPPEAVLQNVTAVAIGTICNDVAFPASAAGYQQDVHDSRAAFPLTAGMPRGPMACAAWPFAPKEPPVRIGDKGRSSFLLVQNERDVATPLSGARKLREALGRRAVMVTVDSTGHDAYLANGNACGDATVTRFLATGRRPATDLYCR